MKTTKNANNITVNWKPECNLNPNYRITCKRFGLGYRANVFIEEQLTDDMQNVSQLFVSYFFNIISIIND